MSWSLWSLGDQELLDAGGEADSLASGDHEGAQVIGQVARQAITDETVRRWWS